MLYKLGCMTVVLIKMGKRKVFYRLNFSNMAYIDSEELGVVWVWRVSFSLSTPAVFFFLPILTACFAFLALLESHWNWKKAEFAKAPRWTWRLMGFTELFFACRLSWAFRSPFEIRWLFKVPLSCWRAWHREPPNTVSFWHFSQCSTCDNDQHDLELVLKAYDIVQCSLIQLHTISSSRSPSSTSMFSDNSKGARFAPKDQRATEGAEPWPHLVVESWNVSSKHRKTLDWRVTVSLTNAFVKSDIAHLGSAILLILQWQSGLNSKRIGNITNIYPDARLGAVLAVAWPNANKYWIRARLSSSLFSWTDVIQFRVHYPFPFFI